MPEMWEQEGLGCAGPRLRGDIQKELRGRRVALSRTITPRGRIGILRCLPTASGRLGIRTFKTPLSWLRFCPREP
jgi:hypothetical protein